MGSFPLLHTVEVSSVEDVTDPFGNVVAGVGEFSTVHVAGWAVSRVEESAGDSVMRTVDTLDVYLPDGFAPGARVRLPDGSVWEVQGNPEDFRHGPFWDPGLVVSHARKVEG